MARLRVKVRLVMLGPNTISSGRAAFTKSARAWRALATTSSVRRLNRKAPWKLLLAWVKYCPIASMTDLWTWVPPGPSIKMSGRPPEVCWRAGNCFRSSVTAA